MDLGDTLYAMVEFGEFVKARADFSMARQILEGKAEVTRFLWYSGSVS